LLLDEMMSGLTPTEMEQALKLVKSISDSGITLIVVEHVMKAILNISSKLVVLNYGKKIAEGKPREVVSNQKVVDAYLGE
jgi:branched-chain amino acid transport system ATP-binding protein